MASNLDFNLLENMGPYLSSSTGPTRRRKMRVSVSADGVTRYMMSSDRRASRMENNFYRHERHTNLVDSSLLLPHEPLIPAVSQLSIFDALIYNKRAILTKYFSISDLTTLPNISKPRINKILYSLNKLIEARKDYLEKNVSRNIYSSSIHDNIMEVLHSIRNSDSTEEQIIPEYSREEIEKLINPSQTARTEDKERSPEGATGGTEVEAKKSDDIFGISGGHSNANGAQENPDDVLKKLADLSLRNGTGEHRSMLDEIDNMFSNVVIKDHEDS